MVFPRRTLRGLPLALIPSAVVATAPPPQPPGRFVPLPAGSAGAEALLSRLLAGGLVLFFRHAATQGQPCDRSFRVGDRAGQRNLSAEGRVQAALIGEMLRQRAIPLAWPALAGPVFRARDTAEAAFGTDRVRVTDDLLADDYAGERLPQVLAGHRRLFNTSAADPALNAVLVGHRTPAIMVLGDAVGGRALPEGGALVLRPGEAGPEVLGIIDLVPLPWRDGC